MTKKNGDKQPIEKIVEGTYEIEGLYYNDKSKFKPSYLLFGTNGKTYSASGHLAKQLEEYVDILSNVIFEMTVEKVTDKRFNKDFYSLVSLKKIGNKELPQKQTELIGFESVGFE